MWCSRKGEITEKRKKNRKYSCSLLKNGDLLCFKQSETLDSPQNFYIPDLYLSNIPWSITVEHWVYCVYLQVEYFKNLNPRIPGLCETVQKTGVTHFIESNAWHWTLELTKDWCTGFLCDHSCLNPTYTCFNQTKNINITWKLLHVAIAI